MTDERVKLIEGWLTAWWTYDDSYPLHYCRANSKTLCGIETDAYCRKIWQDKQPEDDDPRLCPDCKRKLKRHLTIRRKQAEAEQWRQQAMKSWGTILQRRPLAQQEG